MSSAPQTVDDQYFDIDGAVDYVHSKGLVHATERTIIRATYEGRKLLKRTKIGERRYWGKSDIDRWIALCRS